MLEDLGDSGEAIPIPNVSTIPILKTDETFHDICRG
jgi:hypothetical protein